MEKWFSVRVEIHGGGSYDLLHAVMHDLGFRRFVPRKDASGVFQKYRLPTGSYLLHDLTGKETTGAITARVSAVANEVEKGKKPPHVWGVELIACDFSLDQIPDDPDQGYNGLDAAKVRQIRKAANV